MKSRRRLGWLNWPQVGIAHLRAMSKSIKEVYMNGVRSFTTSNESRDCTVSKILMEWFGCVLPADFRESHHFIASSEININVLWEIMLVLISVVLFKILFSTMPASVRWVIKYSTFTILSWIIVMDNWFSNVSIIAIIKRVGIEIFLIVFIYFPASVFRFIEWLWNVFNLLNIFLKELWFYCKKFGWRSIFAYNRGLKSSLFIIHTAWFLNELAEATNRAIGFSAWLDFIKSTIIFSWINDVVCWSSNPLQTILFNHLKWCKENRFGFFFTFLSLAVVCFVVLVIRVRKIFTVIIPFRFLWYFFKGGYRIMSAERKLEELIKFMVQIFLISKYCSIYSMFFNPLTGFFIIIFFVIFLCLWAWLLFHKHNFLSICMMIPDISDHYVEFFTGLFCLGFTVVFIGNYWSYQDSIFPHIKCCKKVNFHGLDADVLTEQYPRVIRDLNIPFHRQVAFVEGDGYVKVGEAASSKVSPFTVKANPVDNATVNAVLDSIDGLPLGPAQIIVGYAGAWCPLASFVDYPVQSINDVFETKICFFLVSDNVLSDRAAVKFNTFQDPTWLPKVGVFNSIFARVAGNEIIPTRTATLWSELATLPELHDIVVPMNTFIEASLAELGGSEAHFSLKEVSIAEMRNRVYFVHGFNFDPMIPEFSGSFDRGLRADFNIRPLIAFANAPWMAVMLGPTGHATGNSPFIDCIRQAIDRGEFIEHVECDRSDGSKYLVPNTHPFFQCNHPQVEGDRFNYEYWNHFCPSSDSVRQADRPCHQGWHGVGIGIGAYPCPPFLSDIKGEIEGVQAWRANMSILDWMDFERWHQYMERQNARFAWLEKFGLLRSFVSLSNVRMTMLTENFDSHYRIVVGVVEPVTPLYQLNQDFIRDINVAIAPWYRMNSLEFEQYPIAATQLQSYTFAEIQWHDLGLGAIAWEIRNGLRGGGDGGLDSLPVEAGVAPAAGAAPAEAGGVIDSSSTLLTQRAGLLTDASNLRTVPSEPPVTGGTTSDADSIHSIYQEHNFIDVQSVMEHARHTHRGSACQPTPVTPLSGTCVFNHDDKYDDKAMGL